MIVDASESCNPFASATELAAALRKKRLSSRELLDIYLNRIERHNPALNAVVTLDVERAQAAADAADEVTARGEAAGALHGLPVTIKDCLATAGLRTTAGAAALADYVPDQDAIAVSRMRDAGAIVLGKTNLPEFAGDAQSYNALFGTNNNPWDITRTPGGSAAAIAAGLSALELGSGLGGSLRIPAHFCGVYTLKPTYGIVPLQGHIPPLPGVLAEMDVGLIGPLARSAADLDLCLSVIASPDAAQGVAWRLQLPLPRADSLMSDCGSRQPGPTSSVTTMCCSVRSRRLPPFPTTTTQTSTPGQSSSTAKPGPMATSFPGFKRSVSPTCRSSCRRLD